MGTQEPLQRVSKGLVHSFEKIISHLLVGEWVVVVFILSESVPMLPIILAFKGKENLQTCP